jgi:hypothetical protein
MLLARRLVAEGLGTAFLLMMVIGSGIMGERLAGGNIAIALLANSLATGCGLAVLILSLGSPPAPETSGCFEPVYVELEMWSCCTVSPAGWLAAGSRFSAPSSAAASHRTARNARFSFAQTRASTSLQRASPSMLCILICP